MRFGLRRDIVGCPEMMAGSLVGQPLSAALLAADDLVVAFEGCGPDPLMLDA